MSSRGTYSVSLTIFDHAEAMFLCVTVSVKQADPERSTVVLPRGHAASILYDKRHRQRIAHESPDTENFSDLKRNLGPPDILPPAHLNRALSNARHISPLAVRVDTLIVAASFDFDELDESLGVICFVSRNKCRLVTSRGCQGPTGLFDTSRGPFFCYHGWVESSFGFL